MGAWPHCVPCFCAHITLRGQTLVPAFTCLQLTRTDAISLKLFEHRWKQKRVDCVQEVVVGVQYAVVIDGLLAWFSLLLNN